MIYVPKNAEGLRLDKWLRTQFPQVPYTTWARLCRKGNIRLDGKRVTGSERLEPGQSIRIPPMDVLKKSMVSVETLKVQPLSAAMQKELESWIIYENNEMLALNKPAGLAVQGGTKTIKHVDGLLARWAMDKDFTPKLIHRLDRDTSGVLLIAKTDQAARELGKLFKTHQIEKYYVAITVGVPNPLEGSIKAAISKGIKDNKERMVVTPKGLKSITHYQVLDKMGKKAAVVALSPVSGRTHQLRVHLEHIQTPILGDPKYGGADDQEDLVSSKTLHLHSCVTVVPWPGKKPLLLEADFPLHFQSTFKDFGFTSGSILKDLKHFIADQKDA
ncbi:MAG: RluA family pseudouridine synthase [Alphaproteobacteria bacterium]